LSFRLSIALVLRRAACGEALPYHRLVAESGR